MHAKNAHCLPLPLPTVQPFVRMGMSHYCQGGGGLGEGWEENLFWSRLSSQMLLTTTMTTWEEACIVMQCCLHGGTGSLRRKHSTYMSGKERDERWSDVDPVTEPCLVSTAACQNAW